MKLLFVHKQVLFPHDTGGKIRALNVLRHLARWHEVTYLCMLRPGEESQLPAMRELGLRVETVPARESRWGSPRFFAEVAGNVASPFPFTVARNYDPVMRAVAERLTSEESYDVVIADCVQMARHCLGLKTRASVLFQHNVEAQIVRRYAETSRGLKARYMRHQWSKMHQFESEAGRKFDGVIAISVPDKRIFEADYGWDHVEAIDTSVDLSYFRPDPAINEVAGRVVFVGSMDWLPNQGGVRWFVESIWPAVRRSCPEATFQVVGRRPSKEVRSFDGKDGVQIIGTVPDTRPYIAGAEVSVVPLLVGGGTRLKIFEAMAMRKAMVSTTLGAEGLDLNDGEHLLIADNPQTFAERLIRFLKSPELREQTASASHRLVNERYGSEPIARQFERICIHALATVEGRAMASTELASSTS